MTAKKPAAKPKATPKRRALQRSTVPRSTVPRYEVTVAAHRIERWEIPAASLEVHAETLLQAAVLAVLAFHVRVGVPPFRRYSALTREHLTIRRIQTEPQPDAEEFQ